MNGGRTQGPDAPRLIHIHDEQSTVGRVLVIDEDPAVRATIEALVMIAGCEVEPVSTMTAGVEAIRRASPGLVFLQGDRPFDETVDHVRAVRDAVGWRVPLVLVGAAQMREEGVLEIFDCERLLKPFDARHVFAIIERNLSCPHTPRG